MIAMIPNVFLAFVAFFISSAHAGEASAALLPRTVIAMMTTSQEPESALACSFAARHAQQLGHQVANHCGGPESSKANKGALPNLGDPVLIVVFSTKPVDPVAVKRILPPQATVGPVGTSVIGLFSSPFVEGAHNSSLTDSGGPMTATINFPSTADPGVASRAFVRCLFEIGTGLTFDETTTCWGRISLETEGIPISIRGGWNPLLNNSKFFYPPRENGDREEKTARALRQYDAQRPKLKASWNPPAEMPLTEPSLAQRPWSTSKIVLTATGATTMVVTAIGLGTVYSKAGTLAEDISAGEYGVAGDSRLATAAEEYERLGRMTPWLWTGVGAGVALSGVGLALPVKSDSEVAVSLSTFGISLNGTF